MAYSYNRADRLRDRKDEERNVVFLDIDGVLQPGVSQNRFDYDLIQTRADIAEKMKDNAYLELDKYDVGAVYYDWHEQAVKNLRRLLEYYDAEIVISSDWKRSKSLDQLKLLFRLHQLDEFITDMTPYTMHSFKPEEIKEYLAAHPNLKSYVVIDDLDMEKHFRGHTVYTGRESFLTASSMWKAGRILEFGPFWEERYYEKTDPKRIGTTKLIDDHYKKVIFLDIDGVLNDDGENRDKKGVMIDDYFVRNLSTIIEKTGAEVILSSSWRYGFISYAHHNFDGSDKSMEALLECLDRYHIKIAGSTPLYFNGPDGRPFEVRAWLCQRPDIEKFVILDDETFWKWNWLELHVVCTSCMKTGRGTGLDRECVHNAILILGGEDN